MKFSRVTISQGVEFPVFPIHFAWALHSSATALPVIPDTFDTTAHTGLTAVALTKILDTFDTTALTGLTAVALRKILDTFDTTAHTGLTAVALRKIPVSYTHLTLPTKRIV